MYCSIYQSDKIFWVNYCHKNIGVEKAISARYSIKLIKMSDEHFDKCTKEVRGTF